jgi:hypothetical protein
MLNTATATKYKVLVLTGHPAQNEFLKNIDGVMTMTIGQYDEFDKETAQKWVNYFSDREEFNQFDFSVKACVTA